jgi:hypothetical protein
MTDLTFPAGESSSYFPFQNFIVTSKINLSNSSTGWNVANNGLTNF